MSLQWDPKDPNEVLDYDIDWSQRLDSGDTISTSSWSVVSPDAALVIDSNTHSGTATKVWLSGGTVLEQGAYLVRNRIVTANGRTMDQSVKLRIKEK